ncbi:MAG: tRNA pseudouridine(55) synthase TruB [Bacilli bacterium]
MNSGVILVNKPSGYTSRDIVNIYQKKLQTKKIGHCGTLDPLAKGVLVLCVGNATKLVPYLTSTRKQYLAKMQLGVLTTTCDLDGEVIEKSEINVSDEEIKKVFDNFPNTYIQEVPIYSAVKVNGKKLYEYARAGEEVELPKRKVVIESLKLINIERVNNMIEIEFLCNVSKGTYIRSLCVDLAKELNTVAVMSNLVRVNQGSFSIDECQNIEDEVCIIDINKITFPYPRIDLKTIKDVKYGRSINNDSNYEGIVTLYYNDELIAFYESNDDILKSKRGVKVWK